MNKKVRLIDGTKELSKEEMLDLLEKGEYGVISTVGRDNMPYGFPMSYILEGDYIYFHCALGGHKVDNIKHNDKVSFCLVGKTRLIPEDLDTGYESIIIFGRAIEVEDKKEKIRALVGLVKKYAPDYLEAGIEEANRDESITGIYKIKIEKMTGKTRRM